MDKNKLIDIIIRTLTGIGKYSPEALNLILGTIAQESAFGKYRRQLGGGIALGICQIEPDTFNDIVDNYLFYKPDLKCKIMKTCKVSSFNAKDLVENDRLSVAMCRCQYARFPEPLPGRYDVEGMAMLYKLRYNTPLGKATEEEFIENYKRYVEISS